MPQHPFDVVWTAEYVRALAPRAAPSARKVLAQGGLRAVEPTADGRGWWGECRAPVGGYQVTVRRGWDRLNCRCDCPSPTAPCAHAIALLLHLVEHPELRATAGAPEPPPGDFEALLRAVFASPDDDTPRLVFADYLDESSEEAVGAPPLEEDR
ncbi:TIGR02996 domain-containing protein [Gemmata sp. JC717]|uniref:TIGR02996 domain-containing protein n=1 Tax=Gemmata algarum TaxID=2975278 RepID=UPI0021BB2EB8|nr:TIGR02996 domain-containing protein [Gemmata algarum]MDY3556859.1 TIGR02996 domain-containing protein [Gemmata algarum]